MISRLQIDSSDRNLIARRERLLICTESRSGKRTYPAQGNAVGCNTEGVLSLSGTAYPSLRVASPEYARAPTQSMTKC